MALLHVDFFSETLGMCMNMDVILPQETKGQIGMETVGGTGKLKTLYLLHGMSDDQTIWQRRTSIERYVSTLGIAVVMPTTHLYWYTNTTFGENYWTFVSEELPCICQGFFPQLSDRREDRLAAGLSMGGYGAWKLGLGANETFGAAASLSGALDILEDYNRQMAVGDSRVKKLFQGVFGSSKDLKGSDNEILTLLEKDAETKKKRTRLFAWCGKQDFLYEGNKKVWKIAQDLGYDLTCRESEGDHQWRYWDEQIQEVLRWWLQTDQDLQ